MIRLGSLAGYPFEGPRLLGGWTPPVRPAVFAILYKPDTAVEQYAVIYVGHSDDLSLESLPFNHADAPCWIARAGDKWRVHVCWYEVPGGLRSHREQITRELVAIYRPSCNPQQYDQTWRQEWIGAYSAPTAGPLTTPQTPTDPA
jgi:hypothetical protein